MGKSNGNRGGVLKVVLIILGVIVVLMVGTGIYVATHWRGWAAEMANTAAKALVEESGLPADQREEILAEIRHFSEDFESGKITTEELGRVAKAIAEGPILPLAGIQGARQKYIEPSDMNPKEKAEATLALQRLARGIYEKKIPTEAIEDVVKPVADLKGNGNWELKNNPTRMEIDQFVANAKARADEAKVSDEPFDLNIAEELRKAIQNTGY